MAASSLISFTHTAPYCVCRRLSFRERPAIIDLSPSSQLAARVTEGVLHTLEEERDATLYYLLARHPGRALVSAGSAHLIRSRTNVIERVSQYDARGMMRVTPHYTTCWRSTSGRALVSKSMSGPECCRLPEPS